MHDLFDSLQSFEPAPGRKAKFYSLPRLEAEGIGPVSRLPVCLRVILESVLRNCDGRKVREQDIRALANWQPRAERTEEVAFIVSRVLLQDFTGVPLLVDLAAMRAEVARLGRDPRLIEPLVPVDLVIDHSVQVDFFRRPDALRLNMETEFARNQTRYRFLKWGMQAFQTVRIVPPGIGICHQVNLEHLASVAFEREGLYFPDTVVGTDSHTTMVNGLGVVGWGVGGIEAEAAMLGLPNYMLMPDVVGVHMTGKLREGVTATDLVLRVTEVLRRANVVGKFVEFHGEGASTLPVPDRATLGNMSPEYGATIGYFPVDERTCEYLLSTGRSREHVDAVRAYFQAQGMFGIPAGGQCEYSQIIELDLGEVRPSVSGPKRPQDRLELGALKRRFLELMEEPASSGGYGKSGDELRRRFEVTIGVDGSAARPLEGGGDQAPESVPASAGNTSAKETSVLTEEEMMNNRPTPNRVEAAPDEFPRQAVQVGHGDVVIAAITSCTNTSNPSVMLAAGLLAKKAVERGLAVSPLVKTSLAPGSRVVTDYFRSTGLQAYLDQLGFRLVGYGCTTCIGNSGPLDPALEEVITGHDIIAASVLSGNRNFEARVHNHVKANFLMSPPLVVAFALAGRVDIDLESEPLGQDADGGDVYLRDVWPSLQEVQALMEQANQPKTYRTLYRSVEEEVELWNRIESPTGKTYKWDPDSTYIQEPPYFEKFGMEPEEVRDVHGARALAIFGDSVTTDHISPAGSIRPDSPAGLYLRERGVAPQDFNSYGARRGNHHVMVRATFANVRIRNLMAPGSEGGVTLHHPDGQTMPIYDAAARYQAAGIPLVVFAGRDYGMGSSRDWAAKGTLLLGVRAVIARSFERIHRSNLLGMGVLPCQFPEGVDARSLGLEGSERFDIVGLEKGPRARQQVTLVIHRPDRSPEQVPLTLRIDTPVEVDFYRHGGILRYVLRQILSEAE